MFGMRTAIRTGVRIVLRVLSAKFGNETLGRLGEEQKILRSGAQLAGVAYGGHS